MAVNNIQRACQNAVKLGMYACNVLKEKGKVVKGNMTVNLS